MEGGDDALIFSQNLGSTPVDEQSLSIGNVSVRDLTFHLCYGHFAIFSSATHQFESTHSVLAATEVVMCVALATYSSIKSGKRKPKMKNGSLENNNGSTQKEQ